MTIAQVVEKLRKEKQNGVASRFPCRAIMVQNIEQYNSLILELKSISDIEVVTSAELFSSADVMPRYENLKNSSYKNRWVILTGVSEYLRLFSKSESATQRFAKLWSYQAPADSLGRILIPLWGCEAQWHDKSLHLCEDIRQEEFYFDCLDQNATEQELHIRVLSDAFEQYINRFEGNSGLHIGLQEWFEYWMAPTPDIIDRTLLTKRFRDIQQTDGNVSIHVIRDTHSFVIENLSDGDRLITHNCPESAVSYLFDAALNGKSLDEAILSALNIAVFSESDVMSRWKSMTDGEKQLVLLWTELYPDGNSYLQHCISNTEQLEQLEQHILLDVFAVRRTHPEWEKQSQILIRALNLRKTEGFFAELDKIPVYEDRLQYLSDGSKEERVYLLRMVGKWMREDAKQVLDSALLRQIYPELHAYLNHNINAMDADLRRYFALYKAHKLENTLPADEDIYFSGINVEHYDYRFAALDAAKNDDYAILWIDALGLEWLPLLLWSIKKIPNSNTVEVLAAQATLPTETSFNDQWLQMNTPYKKLDKLDKLAHKGVIDEPDYYACIEEQLAFISSLQNVVANMLKEHHRIIVTGDHGTSRLAARFFHKRDGLPIPAGAKAFSHGRYCECSSNIMPISTNMRSAKGEHGEKFWAFTNYDHFAQSGFATGVNDDTVTYGEIHGGATPEEVLVPVIVVDSTESILLKADWQKNPVKIMAKKAKTVLSFNRAVQTLQAKIGAVDAVCTPSIDKKQWNLVFAGIQAGTHPVAISADGIAVGVVPLIVQSALGNGDGDLP